MAPMQEHCEPQVSATTAHSKERTPAPTHTDDSSQLSTDDSSRAHEDRDEALPAAARATKRVRFSSTVSSNDVTQLAIVTSGAQLRDKEQATTQDGDTQQQQQHSLDFFAPRFTYHAFGMDETIQGYAGLHITVLFNAFDFRAFLDVKYKEKETIADDIVAKISPSLPQGFTHDRAAFAKDVDSAAQQFTPPGELVNSYSKELDMCTRTFEIYEASLANSDAAQRLLANMQTMALWFIEGADAVDVTDPRWVLYATYERIDASEKRLFTPVGYVTLFKFVNPLGRKGASGTDEMNETHRICQVLVLPTHQRQGHGERLVQCIAQRAVENDKVFELTVEDPVPAFSQLRNLVDVKRCVEHGFFSLAPSASTGAAAPAHGTASLQTTDVRAVQEKLKITQKQVQTCYEVLKLRFVDESDEEQLKKYRLEVKKRLFKAHAEELEGMGSAERRKAFLEVEFQALLTQYKLLLLALA